MSKIKVNVLTNRNEDGAVEFTKGMTIGSSGVLNITGGYNVTGVTTVVSYTATQFNVSGVVSAPTFYGDGSNLTNLPSCSVGKVIAYKRIVGYDEYRA